MNNKTRIIYRMHWKDSITINRIHDTKKQAKRDIPPKKFPSFSYGRKIGVQQYDSKGVNDPNVNGEHGPTLTKDQRDISQTYFLNLQ